MNSRAVSILLAAGALVAAAWILRPRDAAGPHVGDGPDEATTEHAPQPTPGTRGRDTTTARADDPSLLTIEVQTSEANAPITACRVEVVRREDARLPWRDAPLLEGTTNARGVFAIPRVDLPDGKASIIASAAGYQTAYAPLDTDRAVITMRLPRGLSVRGLVESAEGAILEDVQVRVEHVGLPKGPLARATPDKDAGATTTGPDGNFHVSGLAAGSYRVRATAPGWMQTQTPVVPAGADGVRVTLQRVVLVAVRLLHGPTDDPITATVFSARVVDADGGVIATFRSYASHPGAVSATRDGPPLSLIGPDAAPGRLVAPIPTRWGNGPLVLHVEADGYTSWSGPIARHTVQDVAQGQLDDVRLVSLEGEGATLLVEEKHGSVGGRRVLAICRHADRRRAHVRGMLDAEGHWRFVGVPPGRLSVRVFDGSRHSESVEVTAQPNGRHQTTVSYPPTTGVSVRMEAEGHGRLFDAEHVLIVPEGRTAGLPNLATLTRFESTPLGPRTVIEPLHAGSYKYYVNKLGVGEARGRFEVRAGTVTELMVRLRVRPRGKEKR